jgi:hypothetical protein
MKVLEPCWAAAFETGGEEKRWYESDGSRLLKDPEWSGGGEVEGICEGGCWGRGCCSRG